MIFALLLLLGFVSLSVIRAEGRMLRLEKKAGINDPPVPRDALLKCRFRYPAPAREQVTAGLERCHALVDATYSGDGYWNAPGEYPATIRNTSLRVLGYIYAFEALGEELYRRRAIEGLNYLLRVQTDEGDFPWYYRSYRGVYNPNDGLFEAGIAGKAFVEGYRLTGDERYMEASGKTAKWEIDCPISDNNNYNMFAVWHLAAHYEATADKAALKAAIHKTRLGGMPGQFPSGGWPGHNSWMWYHGIITRGMAELYRILPDNHPFKAEIEPALIGAINRAIREQLSSGEVPPNPKVKRRNYSCNFIIHGLLTAKSSFGNELDKCLHGLMRFRLSKLPSEAAVEAFARDWQAYVAAREAAINGSGEDVVWRADFSRHFRDADWGEVVPEAFNCWYPCNGLDPTHHQWQVMKSDRTGGLAQAIKSDGAKLFGGLGWSIPRGVLTPGRRYVFTAYTKCEGDPESVPLILASAYSGKRRDQWDCFSDSPFTRENPSFGTWSRITVPFVASSTCNNVYVWMMGNTNEEGKPISLIVDEAFVVGGGPSVPAEDVSLRDFDSEPEMMLIPLALYLKNMF